MLQRLLTNFEKKDYTIYHKAVAIYNDPNLQIENATHDKNNCLGLWDYSDNEDRSFFWNLWEEIKKLEELMTSS